MGSRITITPHPSHIMGMVSGERCCRVCHAAPWMPISERECGDPARAKPDTEARDAAIAEAYTSGTKVRDIAVLQGVSVDTVKAVARARCTPRKPPSTLPPITPEIVAIAQRRQAAGDRMIDVANDLGIDYKRLRRKLRDILVAEQRRQT